MTNIDGCDKVAIYFSTQNNSNKFYSLEIILFFYCISISDIHSDPWHELWSYLRNIIKHMLSSEDCNGWNSKFEKGISTYFHIALAIDLVFMKPIKRNRGFQWNYVIIPIRKVLMVVQTTISCYALNTNIVILDKV